MTTMTPTMTRTISDQELLALERSYWDALKDRDIRTVGRLTAEKSTVAGASGASIIGPSDIGKLVEQAQYKINDYRIDAQSTHVNRISDDVVAISYPVHEDLEVDGKPVKLDAFDVSVWKLTDNGWTCVLHTESIKGDAYGRDRMQGHSPS
jgi:ketosteroid isomerase-like protein